MVKARVGGKYKTRSGKIVTLSFNPSDDIDYVADFPFIDEAEITYNTDGCVWYNSSSEDDLVEEIHEQGYSVTPHKQKGWFETFTGRKFSILDPQPEDVDIRDIAHALALTCRYGGMCSHFYSVAQHSMSVSENSDNKLWGLLHDAAEAYIGDMPKPFKECMTNFDETESRILAVISDKFGLERQIPEDVHVADKRMLLTEATILLPGCSWVHDYPEKRYEHVKIKYMGPKRAEREFHRMFSDLYY